MKILIDDKSLNITDMEEYYIDEGTEVIVYKYNDLALKIYKDYCRKQRLDLDTAKELSKIETNRILLPKNIIYNDNGKFIGYTTDFINSCSIDSISNMGIKDFIDELDLLYADTDNLSGLGVSMEDLYVMNMIYDGRIILHDPGSYNFVAADNRRFLKSENLELLNGEFIYNLIPRVVKLSSKEKKNFDRYVSYCDDYITDLMRCDVIENETVKTFFKRITK